MKDEIVIAKYVFTITFEWWKKYISVEHPPIEHDPFVLQNISNRCIDELAKQFK